MNPAGPKATGLQPVPDPYRSTAPKLKEPPEVSLGWLLSRSLCFRRYSKGALPSGFSTRAWVGRRWLEPKPALRSPSARQNTAYEPAAQSCPWWPAGLLVRLMFAVCRIVISEEVEAPFPSRRFTASLYAGPLAVKVQSLERARHVCLDARREEKFHRRSRPCSLRALGMAMA